jgi:hypothetical protein
MSASLFQHGDAIHDVRLRHLRRGQKEVPLHVVDVILAFWQGMSGVLRGYDRDRSIDHLQDGATVSAWKPSLASRMSAAEDSAAAIRRVIYPPHVQHLVAGVESSIASLVAC